ncbi:MAG TPA: DUF4382 domain-containing protein [Dinghuibacter sp.]|uniref:DUF4382 domain-containing protein n=1 Tax=Dinghuibacter sp. TaxID=2024697 RepID=UPI002CA26728|nr:DUF4382 domain-containing protein [Dinghuibacter sp.]HTJ10644.1 DUF4382 domain-containing protein [Dinghuibacter sp.]
MKSMKWPSSAVLCVMGMLAVITSCTKSNSSSSSVPPGQQKFNMYLTDGPVNYQAVNIDIQSISVLVAPDSCNADTTGSQWNWNHPTCYQWDSLNITPGVYNILNFQNGIDTLFSATNIPKGKILKIRITLGDNNSIVADSTTFKLDLLWGNTFTINVDECQQVDPGSLALWVDFDAGHSIIEVLHQHFALWPHIRLFTRANSGSVQGTLLPAAADPFVSVISGQDTLIALPGRHGNWEVRGIKSSTVDVTFHATAGAYHDTTISNVNIKPGSSVDLGTVTLH